MPQTQTTQDWLKVAVLSGVLYGIPMGIFFAIQTGRSATGLSSGVLCGILFGTLFALAMRTFAERQAAKFRASPPDFGSESVLLEGPSNHFEGREAVGGYLWLTDGRLHFASHSHNSQNHVWTAQLSDVREVSVGRTLGLDDNGLLISTTEAAERFVVNNSRVWVEVIRKHIHYDA